MQMYNDYHSHMHNGYYPLINCCLWNFQTRMKPYLKYLDLDAIIVSLIFTQIYNSVGVIPELDWIEYNLGASLFENEQQKLKKLMLSEIYT